MYRFTIQDVTVTLITLSVEKHVKLTVLKKYVSSMAHLVTRRINY